MTDYDRLYCVPPKGDAEFAWVPHMVHHLAPAGTAGLVLDNGPMSSRQSGEEACMVALPGHLVYSTQIPGGLWFGARRGPGRSGRGEFLFIKPRGLGRGADRTHCELTDDDIARITAPTTLGATGPTPTKYLPGLCKSAALAEVRRHGHVLTPGTTSKRSRCRTTESRSRRRWGGWWRSCRRSRPTGRGWMPPSPRT